MFACPAVFDQEALAKKCREICILYASMTKHFEDAETKLWVFKLNVQTQVPFVPSAV